MSSYILNDVLKESEKTDSLKFSFSNKVGILKGKKLIEELRLDRFRRLRQNPQNDCTRSHPVTSFQRRPSAVIECFKSLFV